MLDILFVCVACSPLIMLIILGIIDYDSYGSIYKPPKFWRIRYAICRIRNLFGYGKDGHRPYCYGVSQEHWIEECKDCGHFISED